MKDFTNKLKEYLQERGWDNLRPSDVAKSIMIEGAELLEVFQWDNLNSEDIKNDPEKMSKVKKELADVIIYCFDMGIILDIDLEKIVNEKLDKNKEKYPAHLFKDKVKDPGSEDIYWKIKDQYRREGKN